MKKKLPVTIFELVVYILSGLMGLWGLTYLALGMACSFIAHESDLYKADLHLKATTGQMGFLWQGLLVLGIAVVVSVVTLLVTAKKSDREFEKSQRRAARLKKPTETVVDAEVSEVKAED